MQSLRTFLTVLILSVFYPSLLAEDVMEVWTRPTDNSEFNAQIGTLQSMGDGYYVGAATFSNEVRVALKYNGKFYYITAWHNGWEKPIIGEEFTLKYDTGVQHIWVHYGGTYALKAKLSDDKSTITLEFKEPTPLYMSLDGINKKVADNAIGVTGDIKYQSVISVASGSKIINGFKVGDTMYGATSAVLFGDELTAQTRSTNLTAGGQAITLDKRGNYSISVRMTNGVPTQVTINKAEVVPDLKLNGNLLNYSNGIYSGQLSLTKGANVSLVYDNNTYYYIQSDMNGSLESPSGQVTLGTSNRGASVLTRGTYNVEVDIKSLTLTYTNTTPPQPSTLSPTLPAGLVDYSSSSIYVPDEPMTLWYNEEKYANPTKVGNYEAAASEVFLLGNGRMGMTNICSTSETFPIHEKTNYDAKINYDKPTSGMGNYNSITNFTMNNDGESPTWGSQFIRQLDLTTAVASVISRWGDKAYAREYLVNRNYNVGAIHLTADGGAKLSYSFSNGLNGTSAGDGTITVTTGNTKNCNIRFNVTFKVTQKGGTLSTNGGKVSVTDADEITFYFTIATNYDIDSSDYCYSGESDTDLQSRAVATVNKAAAAGWQAIYDDHIAEYSPLFNSVKFTLEDVNNNAPVKDMKAHYEGRYSSYSAESDEHTRAVDMLLFGMGRYLNLASSRGDLDVPSNLQGIWADNEPRWDCDFHNNINQQMNYWAAEITNIPEAHIPMLNYMRKMATKVWHNYAKNIIPGNDGWTIHGATNTFGTSGLLYDLLYPEAAAWNCTHIWQHYLYTQDRQFLSDFFDTMYGACKFYFAYMKDTDGDGQLEIPSYYSPELTSGNSVAVHAQQLVYQHLCNTRDAAKILGKNTEANMCQQYIDRMYNGIEIINGEQCEWKHTTPAATDHRHLSHLMCLYPLAQVSPYDDDRSNFNGAYQALLTRGDTDGGENAAWNTAWKMNCYARALEGDLAMRQLAYGMAERITPDMRTTCKHSFQIEGGAGISAGMAEMLLQSYSGVIDLLPALPESSWHGGSVSGLKAVGNYEVSIDWENNVMTAATIKDCVNQNMRSGTQIRVHTSRLEGGDINMLQINGVNAVDERNVMTRAASNRPTYAYEPTTESYLVTLPAISGNTAQVTFGDVSTGIEEIITDAAESGANGPVEYFDLYGRKVTNPSNGLFIRRQGNQVTKVIL